MTPSTLRKFALFGLVGVINTLVDWTLFWALGAVMPDAETMVWLAKGLSYSAGVLTSFALNARITFRHEYLAARQQTDTGGRRAFLRFWLVASLCLVLNSATYELMRGGVYLDLIALIGATAITYLAGFVLNLRWTFPPGTDSTAS